MEHAETIRLLNGDLCDEHGAIIFYLRIAYQLEDAGMAASLESIARDEMRHYKWLAEEVVRLGGVPTTERAPEPQSGPSALARLQAALQRETHAIETYTAHAQAVGDGRTAMLLQRIASDEQHHLQKFQRLVQTLEESAEPLPQETTEGVVENAPPALEPVQQDVNVEYTTVLQYLLQSFLTPECPLSKDLQDQAVIEMKHMGWLAEHMAEAGVEPQMELGAIDHSRDPQQILQTNIQLEVAVEEMYRRQLENVEDRNLRGLLSRVLEHSVYHEAHFRDLLADLQAQSARKPSVAASPVPSSRPAGWTVGSLLGRKQYDA
ncbi:MAG: ferritin-like domain-containing protein [Armatimonadota bacterium]|nr:ferritin-like domain-containing protein [Armatimonadota bacterium]